ncbi:MAG TPA: hypothetical protein QGF35_04710 [Dehalococcoidia bacterium]|jgi:predicted ArsR family transcriptional regulator|nr:hypothetical protein [Dehalococcoidia bacterium]
MQGTRERILEFVVKNRDVRVEDLASELSITAPAVRRHLDHLRADSLIDARPVKQATGRPYYVYFPTERALGVLPQPYVRLLEGVLQGLGKRPEMVDAVLTGIAEGVAERHRGEVGTTADPETRASRVTGSLREEGILETWQAGDDGIHLVNHQCPYPKAAEMSELPCECDRRTIELLLGKDVEQRRRIVDGSPVCEYVIRSDKEDLSQSELRTERINE